MCNNVCSGDTVTLSPHARLHRDLHCFTGTTLLARGSSFRCTTRERKGEKKKRRERQEGRDHTVDLSSSTPLRVHQDRRDEETETSNETKTTLEGGEVIALPPRSFHPYDFIRPCGVVVDYRCRRRLQC